MSQVDLSVQLAPRNGKGLRLANPVMPASGTFGYGTEYAEIIDIQRLGAIVSKGTTISPRQGNPQPRIVETPAGMLNSIGLENVGLGAIIREKVPLWKTWQVPVIINIAGRSVEEYGNMADGLEGVEGIAGIEVNISCPNVAAGGMEFGTDPKAAAAVAMCVRERTELPMIMKLTPNVTDITEIARAVESAGADAVTVANTFKGMAIDVARRQPVLGNIAGGLSGPAIKPLALNATYRVYQAVKIPIIGCGGIASAIDALEFIMAGASAVQVGTAAFANPHVLLEIVEGIERYMDRESVASIKDLVGVANDGRTRP